MVLKMVAVAASLIGSVAMEAQSQVGTGVISGAVVDEAGRLEPGAPISCQKVNEYSRTTGGRVVLKEPGFVRRVTADLEGKFQVPDLPSGRYNVCASGIRPNQVGSCEWGGVAVIDLAPAQRVQNVIRTVREGAIITVRVADPYGKIALSDARGFAPRQGRFSLELVSPTGSQRRAERISNSATEHVFQLTVPKQWTMRMFLDTDLNIRGESGDVLEVRRPTSQVASVAGRDGITVNLSVQ